MENRMMSFLQKLLIRNISRTVKYLEEEFDLLKKYQMLDDQEVINLQDRLNALSIMYYDKIAL